MRKTRRLLLAALLLAAAGVGYLYRRQSLIQATEAPPPPPPLAPDQQSISKDWVYYKGDGDRPVFEARAREMEQVTVEGGALRMRLKGVNLRLYKKDGKRFDHVESASAEFDQGAATMFAEGEVTITLAERDPDEPGAQLKPVNRERLLKIVTSGVHFAASDGKAETEQPARFEFDLGSGQAVGATYNPQERDLNLHHDVKLDWRGRDKTRPPIHVEADGLIYREAEAKVHLLGHTVFQRKTLNMTGGQSVVTLDDGAIRNVETADARGIDTQPRRELTFAAKALKLDLNDHSEIEHVLGDGGSSVQVKGPAATTDLTAQRLQMEFAAGAENSELVEALSFGSSVLHSRPRTTTGVDRTLHADSIYAKMRPGGEELQSVETRSSGVLDLVPLVAASQPKRHLEATRMWMTYAPANVMDTFRAVDARTRSDRPPEPGKPAPDPAITSSKELTARFDPKTGVMTTLEQVTAFRYDEGPQHATGDKGVMDQLAGKLDLTGSAAAPARAWDSSGQVLAKNITLDQRTGTLVAEGDVVSTREPDKKAPADGAGPLMSQSEPLHGKANRLTISERNTVIVHEGGPKGKAVVWQGANRVEGAKVSINRAKKTLKAEGDVVSLLAQQTKPTDAPAITTVRAASLDYDDSARLADYQGGARLARPGLDLRSTQLRAWLTPAEAHSSGLEHLIADGAVAITQTRPGGWRKSASDHAEYYTAGEKVVLIGTPDSLATMNDSEKGATRGQRITYSGSDDNMQVEGAPAAPPVSRIRRGK